MTGTVLAAACVLGAVPSSQIVARRHGVDLRQRGTGTVSASAVFAALGPVHAAAPVAFDVTKGIVAARLGTRLQGTAHGPALTTALAITGHNWSPFLRGAGGRGLATTVGFLSVEDPIGAAILGVCLATGRLAGQTGLGCFIGYLILLTAPDRRDRADRYIALSPVILKRVAGNTAAKPPKTRTYLHRLFFDHDAPQPAGS